MSLAQKSATQGIRRLGSMLYLASRLAVTSCLSWLQQAIVREELEPIATFRNMKYDETPLILRIADACTAVPAETTMLPIGNIEFGMQKLSLESQRSSKLH
jgi:hypothetical protein